LNLGTHNLWLRILDGPYSKDLNESGQAKSYSKLTQQLCVKYNRASRLLITFPLARESFLLPQHLKLKSDKQHAAACR
jgi:hypothetical protein